MNRANKTRQIKKPAQGKNTHKKRLKMKKNSTFPQPPQPPKPTLADLAASVTSRVQQMPQTLSVFKSLLIVIGIFLRSLWGWWCWCCCCSCFICHTLNQNRFFLQSQKKFSQWRWRHWRKWGYFVNCRWTMVTMIGQLSDLGDGEYIGFQLGIWQIAIGNSTSLS